MKAIYDHIKPLILAGVPALRDVKLYRSQDIHQRDREGNTLPTPACLVEFIPVETRNHSRGIKRILLRVRFRFVLQDFKFEKFGNLDFQDLFDAVVTGLRADEDQTVNFSSFIEAEQSNDYDPDNMVTPYIDYFTWWTKISANKYGTAETTPTPQIEGEIL